jgi:putative methylase
MQIKSRSGLAIALSKLKVFENVNVKLEQYPTDSEIASEVLWDAYMKGDIVDKTIADLGAGTGILGIGTLLLGAKNVEFIEIDTAAIEILQQNTEGFENIKLLNMNVNDYNNKVDVIIQNPPFGTRDKHIDKKFLEKAMKLASTVYSFHKTSTIKYMKKVIEKNNFKVIEQKDFLFPLKQTQKLHKRKIHRIEVSVLKIAKRI